jgi:Fungal specific transcription factor domain
VAVTDPNLLNLMLAYSASHRARFLRHPEPSNRIAHWVSNVFPTLRHALNEPQEKVTDSHLATAIMLLSLKIVSPSTFEVPITWQTHLKLARDLFVARGIHHHARPDNKVAYFLAHWLGYLDIVGSLSCRRSGPPLLHTNYWSTSTMHGIPDDIDGHEDYEGDDDNYRVDCFAGFTPRTGAQLARLAHLTHRCDSERFDEVGNFLTDWNPSEEVIQAGESLLQDMHRARQRGHVLGTHHSELEDNEMIAIDLAFHWSAVIHIHRRVLGCSTYSTEVQEAVNHLCDAIARIRTGSSTECSVLFPLFTAGCESRDPQQRLEMMTRVTNFEAEGLKQVCINPISKVYFANSVQRSSKTRAD